MKLTKIVHDLTEIDWKWPWISFNFNEIWSSLVSDNFDEFDLDYTEFYSILVNFGQSQNTLVCVLNFSEFQWNSFNFNEFQWLSIQISVNFTELWSIMVKVGVKFD